MKWESKEYLRRNIYVRNRLIFYSDKKVYHVLITPNPWFCYYGWLGKNDGIALSLETF